MGNPWGRPSGAGFDLVGVGSACIDAVVRVPRLPGPDESLPMLAYTVQGGGKVATALVAAARLGLRTAFSGAVGDDPFGAQILEEFRREGVDVDGVQVQPGRASAFSTVLADAATGTRSILWSGGSVAHGGLTPADRERVAAARFLLVSEPSPVALEAAAWARQHGVPVVWDADFYVPESRELLPLTDICIASAHFAAAFHPGAGPEEAVNLLGRPITVVTMGSRGALGRSPDGPFSAPAFPVTVVDTTGAGDVFHGAYIAGLCHGYSPARAAVYASAVAALKCRALGGRVGIPSHQETLDFLAANNVPEV